MKQHVQINNRKIGAGQPVYIVAEMSANHHQDFDQATAIIKAAKEAGADAVKLQTYTPDTLTLDCDHDCFRIKGTIWEGKNLYQLYGEAYTPWEWQPELMNIAHSLGLDFFSTPFDATAVDFLEEMGVGMHKVASFELVDLPLLKKVGATGKPVIMSTGMATLAEIDEAVGTLRQFGTSELVLLKCTSAYPAPPEEMNLRTIPQLAGTFGVPAGLSDHSMGIAVPVAAVALGACLIEKHLTLCRADGGPDSAFSLEPDEFRAMVAAVRQAEMALGAVNFEPTEKEKKSRIFRRSLFVVQEMRAGQEFTLGNTASIRPGHGLHPRYLEMVIGRRAAVDIPRGTPLSWELVGEARK
ncbi:MAG: pseudaminic acid synthase [Proteobacteria bacterium]|nr:pseudaminic acid synthase [Pseudomonadota bacterium]MBU0966359.1 pseudaminic acid synthase [Pseudomonadota bacterium]